MIVRDTLRGLPVAEMTDEEFESLIPIILQYSGVDFSRYAESSLKRRILRAMQLYKFEDISSLVAFLPANPGFAEILVNELTVGVTEFFRDPALWKWLRNTLPNFTENKSDVYALHAGCSTGEEAYSLAMLAQEENCNHKLKIHGLDLSSSSIANANAATFSHRKVELLNKNYTRTNPNSTFPAALQQQGANFGLSSLIKNQCHFFKADLFKLDKAPDSYDIIFCRNVLLYFKPEYQEQLLEKFHQLLKPGGMLIMGIFESISWTEKGDLFEVENKDLNVYSKLG